MVQNGADVNVRNKYGKPVLMLAIEAGYEDIVELLLENGADINIQDNNGKTALDIAQDEGDQNIVELIEKYQPKRRLEL